MELNTTNDTSSVEAVALSAGSNVCLKFSLRSRRRRKAWGVSPREKNHLLIHLEVAERATDSTLDVSFVVFNSIRFQEFNKLIAKRNLPVMLFLFRNILAYFVYV